MDRISIILKTAVLLSGFLWAGELEDILRLGDKFFEEKLYGLAVEQYSKYLKAVPDNEHSARILYGLGHGHFLLGHYVKSKEYFDTFIKRYPRHKQVADALYEQAESFYALQQYLPASESYARV